MKIKRACRIESYSAPHYLVTPTGRWHGASGTLVKALNRHPQDITVLERNVKGWGPANAIIDADLFGEPDAEFAGGTYLAEIEQPF